MTTKTPKKLKGFQDFFAEEMQIRNFVIATFKETYEKYGYEPLETPALEYAEFMLGQSGSEAEKQFYRFQDNGGRDVMLKFEVMISMCRALAENINEIPLPYKRYQIQRVWRAENVQKGRYREFTQCDADTIGSDSMSCDAEHIQLGIEVMKKLGFQEFEARISNRKFLEGLAKYLGVKEENTYGFFMSNDKLEKIGKQAVIAELISKRGVEESKAKLALELLDIKEMSFDELIAFYKPTVGTTKIGATGLQELKEIRDFLQAGGADADHYRFDPTIARGLASYTGPVWEFTVIEGNVGSVAGCGRYDKAIGKYVGKDIPATGGSFGIERLCDIIKDRNMFELAKTSVQLLITTFGPELQQKSVQTATFMRQFGVNTIVYPDTEKLGKQYKFADRKNIPYVMTIGPDEAKSGEYKLKELKTGEEFNLTPKDAAEFIIKHSEKV